MSNLKSPQAYPISIKPAKLYRIKKTASSLIIPISVLNPIVRHLVLGLVFILAVPAYAETVDLRHTTNPISMKTGPEIPPPFGYVDFCVRFPLDCRLSKTSNVDRFSIRGARGIELKEVNLSINASIQPYPDMDLYGTEEHWTYPQTAGDCEDYALLKQQTLLKNGWSQQSLLLSVVYDENGDAHTVLLVSTKEGEYVLDNKTNKIRPWHATSYQWLMRQSRSNPLKWLRIVG